MSDQDPHWDRLVKQWEEQAKWDEILRPSVVTKEDPPVDQTATSREEWADYGFIILCISLVLIGLL